MSNRRVAAATFSLPLQATIVNTFSSGKSASASLDGDLIPNGISDGVQTNEITRAFHEATISIDADTNLDIDLADLAARDIGAGSGLDAVGQDIIMEEIVCLVIKNVSGAGVLEINPTLPASPWLVIPQYAARAAVGGGIKTGGCRVWFEPDQQALDTAGAGAEVRLRANGGAVVAELYVFGRHDDDDSSSSSESSSSQSTSSDSTSSDSSTSTSSS